MSSLKVSVPEVKTMMVSLMLAVCFRLSFILELACKSGPLLPYYVNNILDLVKYILEKENCGLSQLVALKQTS